MLTDPIKDTSERPSTEQDLIDVLDEHTGINFGWLGMTDTPYIEDYNNHASKPTSLLFNLRDRSGERERIPYITCNEPDIDRFVVIRFGSDGIDAEVLTSDGKDMCVAHLRLEDIEYELKLAKAGLAIMQVYDRLPSGLRDEIENKYFNRVCISASAKNRRRDYGCLEMILELIDELLEQD